MTPPVHATTPMLATTFFVTTLAACGGAYAPPCQLSTARRIVEEPGGGRLVTSDGAAAYTRRRSDAQGQLMTAVTWIGPTGAIDDAFDVDVVPPETEPHEPRVGLLTFAEAPLRDGVAQAVAAEEALEISISSKSGLHHSLSLDVPGIGNLAQLSRVGGLYQATWSLPAGSGTVAFDEQGTVLARSTLPPGGHLIESAGALVASPGPQVLTPGLSALTQVPPAPLDGLAVWQPDEGVVTVATTGGNDGNIEMHRLDTSGTRQTHAWLSTGSRVLAIGANAGKTAVVFVAPGDDTHPTAQAWLGVLDEQGNKLGPDLPIDADAPISEAALLPAPDGTLTLLTAGAPGLDVRWVRCE